ncbi:MAG: KpsF/GutQ family sugar-phosphate isomerase [Pseudomonadota bacterium]
MSEALQGAAPLTVVATPENEISPTYRRQMNASARRTLMSEQAGISLLAEAFENGLGDSFPKAISLMHHAKGRIIVTGVGKSGHIGGKIAATLASTGTPAFFIHAAEAGHGDLGMVTRDDVIIALSWSGESSELYSIVNYASRFQIPLIAITSKDESSLGREAAVVLSLPRAIEACPHNLAPTTSTIMQLALGDALAIALLEARGFSASDFGLFHPGGQLGAKLRTIGEIMHVGDAMPLTSTTTPMSEAIILMSEKGFGCLGICDERRKLVGMITDGDLRRHMDPDLLHKQAADVMTQNPICIEADKLASATLELMNSSGQGGITSVFVVEHGRPIGIVSVHDLLRLGVA